MENHQFELLQKKSGYHFQNPHLLNQAMTHSPLREDSSICAPRSRATMPTVRKAMPTAVNMVTLMKKDIIMTMIAAVAVMIMNMSKTAWTPIGMFPALILLNTVCSSLPSVRLQVLRTSV